MSNCLRLFACLSLVGLLAACGSSSDGDDGGGLICGVGETVAEDSQGNRYCAPATGGADGGVAFDAGGAADTGGGGGGGADTGGSSSGGALWSQCPPKVNPGGLPHGKKCAQDSDCLYSRCVKGGFLTSYDDTISYCTKNNACAGGASQETAPCGVDNGTPAGATFYVAFEKSKSGGNPKRTSASPYKVCAYQCKSDADCAAWNPEMPDCIKASTDYISVGVNGVCGKNTLK